MPNNVENIIALKGNDTQIREMLEAIQNDDYGLGTVDFNKIIPMPQSLKIESGGITDSGLKLYKEFISECLFDRKETDVSKISAEELAESEKAFLKQRSDIKADEWELGKTAWNNIQNYGFPTWYEWCINNWGTKWNAYGYGENTDYSKCKNLWFQTAWSAPHPVLQKLSEMYPDITFEHEWADEDIGTNCGRKVYSGGECTESYYPEGEKDAIEFACRVFDYDTADLDLMLNKAENGYVNIEMDSYDLISLFGKPALFTNEKLTNADIPKGLYCYHIREGNDGEFAAVEPKVKVNHAGSVITNEPIDLGTQGYISFTEDTIPNFIGNDLTFGEYMRGEFEQNANEAQNIRGISDYEDNSLGGFIEEKQKPDCKLIGEDGNIFNLIGIATRTLRQNGLAQQAVEMRERVCSSGSYGEALCIIGEYVNITGDDTDEDMDESMEFGGM